MPVTINGNGSITGLSVGGLGAGVVTQANRTYSTGEIIQTVSNTFNTEYSFGTGDGSGQATSVSAGFSVIPSATYVNVTAKRNNSKYLVTFQGNVSTMRGLANSQSDGINGFGFVLDPAGGTSFTAISGSVNAANSTNTKFFQSRASTYLVASGGDAYWKMLISGSTIYTSTKTAGSTLRFAIEYFHYDNTSHDIMYINRAESSTQSGTVGGNQSYSSGNASNVTVMEIAA